MERKFCLNRSRRREEADLAVSHQWRRLPALTLALSPEERGPAISALDQLCNGNPFPALDNILPLLGGEGRGEVERFFSLNGLGLARTDQWRGLFALTLALSPRERGQRLASVESLRRVGPISASMLFGERSRAKVKRLPIIKTRPTILPLLGGEGRGEVERFFSLNGGAWEMRAESASSRRRLRERFVIGRAFFCDMLDDSRFKNVGGLAGLNV